jgi:hypothetical protein
MRGRRNYPAEGDNRGCDSGGRQQCLGAVLDEGPWHVDEQLGMEKCDLYLEGVEEDTRRGLHRATDKLEMQWRDWSAL